jgi:hypothetical protein
MEWGFWIVFLAVVAVALLFAWLASRARRKIEQQRTDAIRQVSPGFGMNYVADGSTLLESEGFLKSSKLLCPYHSSMVSLQKIRNVVISSDRTAMLFDDEYMISAGEGAETYRFTVAAFRFPVNLPKFVMRPKYRRTSLWVRVSGWHRIRAILGPEGSDIHQRFLRRYVVHGKNEVATISFFRPAVLEHFAQERGWSVEGTGSWLLAWRTGKRVAPKNLSKFMQQTTRIAQLFRESQGA